MSQPEAKLIAMPGTQGPVKAKRDLRIDMFRGLALAMIFIDHVPGNPYEYGTVRNIGFSDAAEAFFLMSGIAAGLAYSGRFLPERVERTGVWQAMAPLWSRAWLLYVVHVLLTVTAIAIFAGGVLMFRAPELLQQINLAPLVETPLQAVIGIPLMTHQLGYVNILPAYAVLLFVLPAIIPLAERFPYATLGASLTLWFVTGLLRLNLPNFPNEGGWFFNPFAWQALFTVGLLTGIFMRRGERFVPVYRGLFWACVGYLLFSLAWLYLPGMGPRMDAAMTWLRDSGVPFHITNQDKTFLALPRFAHALSLAYVLSCLPFVVTVAESRWTAPLRLMGRHGLQVFAAGTLLALLFQTVVQTHPHLLWPAIVLPPLGLALQLMLAWGREASARSARRGRKAPQAPANTPRPASKPAFASAHAPAMPPGVAPFGAVPAIAAPLRQRALLG